MSFNCTKKPMSLAILLYIKKQSVNYSMSVLAVGHDNSAQGLRVQMVLAIAFMFVSSKGLAE